MAARVTVRYRPIAVIAERLDPEDVSRLGKAIGYCRLRMPRRNMVNATPCYSAPSMNTPCFLLDSK